MGLPWASCPPVPHPESCGGAIYSLETPSKVASPKLRNIRKGRGTLKIPLACQPTHHVFT